MKASYRSLLAILAAAVASPLAAQDASRDVPVCEREHKTYVEAAACRKAAEGVTELRRYLWNTRTIHNLRPEPFMRRSTPAATAGEPQQKRAAG